MNIASRGIATLVVLGSLLGCGYSLHASLDPRYQTIHVSAFQNQSREFDLQGPLTTSLIRRFVADGRLRVVNRDRADLVLEGTLLDYAQRGLSFERGAPTQLAVTITASVRLIDGHTGEVLWEDPAFSASTNYASRSTPSRSDRLRGNAQVFTPIVRSFPTDAENHAASEVLDALALDLFYRTVEPW
ncbi:MAG: LptE family protein [Candidatus Hydrogenedentes bacterium]|nr:LptE family protein [Candidatus Hydrogenedentota bacterium]